MRLLSLFSLLAFSLSVFGQGGKLSKLFDPNELRIKAAGPSIALNDSVIILSADDDINGTELWRTDGTLAGTYMIKDLFPGEDPERHEAGSSSPELFFHFNDEIFFVANSKDYGFELHKTDGTAEGTSIVKDVWTGNLGGLPTGGEFSQYIDTSANYIYFRARASKQDPKCLYQSDGTGEGTQAMTDKDGNLVLYPFDFANFDDLLFFVSKPNTGNNALWYTDGTPSGTMSVSPDSLNIEGVFEACNGHLIFVANNGNSSNNALWSIESSATKNYVLKKLSPEGQWFSGQNEHIVYKNEMYTKSENQTETGGELWKTDGTPEGTAILKDINTHNGSDSVASSNPFSFIIFENYLFFSAIEWTAPNNEFYELWLTDGTESGTKKYTNINNSANSPIKLPYNQFIYDNRLYFTSLIGDNNKFCSLSTYDGDITIHEGAGFDYTMMSMNYSFVTNKYFFIYGDLGEAEGRAFYQLEEIVTAFDKPVLMDDANTISIFPNPTRGVFSIQSKVPILKFEIYNTYGALMGRLINNNTFDLSACSTGMYYVKAFDENGSIQLKKIIKK
jgi:ELWxxDGT repeat protein